MEMWVNTMLGVSERETAELAVNSFSADSVNKDLAGSPANFELPQCPALLFLGVSLVFQAFGNLPHITFSTRRASLFKPHVRVVQYTKSLMRYRTEINSFTAIDSMLPIFIPRNVVRTPVWCVAAQVSVNKVIWNKGTRCALGSVPNPNTNLSDAREKRNIAARL